MATNSAGVHQRSSSERLSPLNLAWKVLRSMNVEPALFLFSIQIGCQQTVLQPFLYWRRCIELYFDETFSYDIEQFCLHLSDYNDTSYNNQVQTDVSIFQQYLTICTSVPSLFLCPIICAWSDGTGGRKRPLIIALAAIVIAHLPYLVCTIFVKISQYWILLGAVINSLGGSAMVVFATCFSWISDEARMRRPPPPVPKGSMGPPAPKLSFVPPETPSEEDKIMTIRIGLASGVFMLGTVFGCLIGTTLRASDDFSDYYWPFFISEVAVALAFFYIIVFARESRDFQSTNQRGPPTASGRRLLEDESTDEANTDSQYARSSGRQANSNPRRSQYPRGLVCTCAATFPDILKGIGIRLKEAAQALTARRRGHKRMLIWMGLGFNFLQMCCSMGMGSLYLLFLKRKPLSWTDVQFGYFQAYINAMAALGMTVIPFVVNNLPYVRHSPSKDTIIVMIGCISSATYFSLFAFSATNSMVYMSGAFMMFANLFLPGFRSFFSKMVGPEETARIFAAVGMLENFTPMIAALVFNNIYNASLSFNFAGFAFLVSAVLHAPVLLGMLYIHVMMVRDSKQNKPDRLLDSSIRSNEQLETDREMRQYSDSPSPEPEGKLALQDSS